METLLETGGICEDGMVVNTFPEGLMNYPLLCPPDLFPAKQCPLPVPEPIETESSVAEPDKPTKKHSNAAASRNYRKRQKEASEEMANKNNVLNLEITCLKARNDAMETQVWKMVEELQTTYRTLKDERLRIAAFEQEVQSLRQLVADQSQELDKLRAPAH